MPRKQTRIMFDAHALLNQKTGVGYYVDQLITEFARMYPDIEFVGYYHNFLYRKHITNLPSAPNIHYRRIAFMPGQIVNLLRRFHILLPVELLTFTRADFLLFPNFLGLASLFHTPTASVIHDLTFVDLPEYVSARNLSDLRRFIPAQIRRSDFLITVSEFGKRRITEEFNVPADDILVTPIPSQKPLRLATSQQRQALGKLGIPGKFFLTLGTIEPRKNLLNMLDAYLLLPEPVQQEYAFVVAGKVGWNCERELARLEQLKAEGKNVLHVGYVSDEDRAALYQNATFFTWASHYEGFGMPILEAMSYGTACAISEIPVFREIAGDAALYFNQQQPKSIGAAWTKLIIDAEQRQQLANKGKRHTDTYDWPTVVTSLHDRIVALLR